MPKNGSDCWYIERIQSKSYFLKQKEISKTRASQPTVNLSSDGQIYQHIKRASCYYKHAVLHIYGRLSKLSNRYCLKHIYFVIYSSNRKALRYSYSVVSRAVAMVWSVVGQSTRHTIQSMRWRPSDQSVSWRRCRRCFVRCERLTSDDSKTYSVVLSFHRPEPVRCFATRCKTAVGSSAQS